MLLHQGAAAFTLWTGLPAPVDVMQRALVRRPAPSGVRSAEGEPAGAEATAAGAGRRPAPRAADHGQPEGWVACAG